MATFTVENLTFTYPERESPAIQDLNFQVDYGEFVLVFGQTGCGKSTLLRNLKSVLAPYGQRQGKILFYGKPLEEVPEGDQAKRIGYVLQNPDNQIVTDKVWHELAFGLESLGYDNKVIRLRVAEMANFFGIQDWFLRDTEKLSGGQKQTLNLASVMAMQPDVLILDEPTAQLDPIAASEFLATVRKINREIGTTIIMTEHRLEEVFPMADKVLMLDQGRLLAFDKADRLGEILAGLKHPMVKALPAPLQVYESCRLKGLGVERQTGPLSVREGRTWLTDSFKDKTLKIDRIDIEEASKAREYGREEGDGKPLIKVKDLWFRYSKQDKDVLKDFSLEVDQGQLHCILGGNGSGKTTALSLIGGYNKAYRGKVKVDKSLKISMLPQNPQTLFVEKRVEEDLMEVFYGYSEKAIERVSQIADLLEISHLLKSHPYDLSGGEQQRAALAKVLLTEPDIILLDEPTKGLDNDFKERLAGILKKLTQEGKTIIMVSHDIEFCAKYGDKCSMLFDGSIMTTNTPNRFFSGNSFYTTAANRMSRHIFENAVTVDQVKELCQKNLAD